MKLLSSALLGLVLLANVGNASVGVPAPAPTVAPKLEAVKITQVGKNGRVAKQRHSHPFTDFMITVPARISTVTACTKFVGITESLVEGPAENRVTVIAMGATHPLIDACIEVVPKPVDANVVFTMRVLTGGFVPAQPIQKQVVQFQGAGLYTVTLDMNNQQVSIVPAVSHR